MAKFVFTTLSGAVYSAEADTEYEAKAKILKAHSWIRSWDLQIRK